MTPAAPPSRTSRALYVVGGLACVAIGGLGVVIPGLPSTIFFIGAAACFTRSSPRLERWLLDLPGVGPLVRDHRDGLGMPRRAKAWAIASMWLFTALGAWGVGRWPFTAGVGALATVGTLVVAFRVPTQERVLQRRREPGPAGDPVDG